MLTKNSPPESGGVPQGEGVCALWITDNRVLVILNEREVSQLCLQRFLHCVFEMTKLCFVIGEFYGHRSREAQTEFVPRGWPTAKRANDLLFCHR